MTDTDLITADDRAPRNEAPAAVETPSDSGAKRGGSLATMVLPELRTLATQAGVKGTSGMRKGELIAAIREAQGGNGGRSGGDERSRPAQAEARSDSPAEGAAGARSEAKSEAKS